MIGVAKRIEIGPPSSKATFVPEWGGSSNSLSEMPALMAVALVNVIPGNCVVMGVPSTMGVLSGNVSKSIVVVSALRGEGITAANRTRRAIEILRGGSQRAGGALTENVSPLLPGEKEGSHTRAKYRDV